MDSLSLSSFSPLEHRVLKRLRQEEISSCSILLCVSGGLDSVCMAQLLIRLKDVLSLQLAGAHVHHGPATKISSQNFRDQTQELVRRFFEQRSIPFFTNEEVSCGEENEGSKTGPKREILTSEEDFRKFRYSKLAEFQQSWKGSENVYLALGHHQEDLLETRLIRLIRGVGPEGIESISFFKNGRLRPLIEESKKELKSYAKLHSLEWLDDPTNRSGEPLRNWLRESWLPQLEAKRTGAMGVLAQSLQQLSDKAFEGVKGDVFSCIEEGKINHQLFLELSRSEKSRVLARFLRRKNVKSYGRSHIEEILKRLDTEKKTTKFRLLRCDWSVSCDWIECEVGSVD